MERQAQGRSPKEMFADFQARRRPLAEVRDAEEAKAEKAQKARDKALEAKGLPLGNADERFHDQDEANERTNADFRRVEKDAWEEAHGRPVGPREDCHRSMHGVYPGLEPTPEEVEFKERNGVEPVARDWWLRRCSPNLESRRYEWLQVEPYPFEEKFKEAYARWPGAEDWELRAEHHDLENWHGGGGEDNWSMGFPNLPGDGYFGALGSVEESRERDRQLGAYRKLAAAKMEFGEAQDVKGPASPKSDPAPRRGASPER